MSDLVKLGHSWTAIGQSVWGFTPWNARVRLANVNSFSPTNGIDSDAVALMMAHAPKMYEALHGLVAHECRYVDNEIVIRCGSLDDALYRMHKARCAIGVPPGDRWLP